MTILAKIKSIYILDILFDYIKEENFKYKLFVHSKKYQKILKINLLDYKKIILIIRMLNLLIIYITQIIYKKKHLIKIYIKKKLKKI